MFLFFFFNDTATTEIYTLSLHDALPIYFKGGAGFVVARKRFSFPLPEAYAFTFDVHGVAPANKLEFKLVDPSEDRKSTRLNSSHGYISYAVFCLKKKKHSYYTSTLATIT